MPGQELHLYLDVNVYLDAFIAWNDEMRPTVLVTDEENAVADPACLLLAAIRARQSVNGQNLVLHTSSRVVALVVSKLIADYGWVNDRAMEAGQWIIDLTIATGGSMASDQSAPAVVPGLRDLEDRHRIAEARACEVDLFLTRDGEVLDAADPTVKPFPMKPRAFVDRSRG